MTTGKKRARQILFAVVVSFCLSGCLPPSSVINMVSPGMTRQQVIDVMGEPVSTTATYTNEYLNYALAEGCRVSVPLVRCPLTSYFVRLTGGKVDAYGRSADIGTIQATPHSAATERK